ncbi:MAG: DUF2007 domain-containing protein [Tissierellia bacterium]|nr:DUF2007 domain-containing protein [Tissierellia bacterium]
MVDYNNEEGALLLSGLSTMEASIIISKLKSFGIPVLKKTKGTGQLMEIYTGSNPYGTDIYVPSDMVEFAMELLEKDEETEEIEE